MPHPDEGLLHALIDGELPAAEAVALEAHLERCGSCRDRAAEARKLRGEALELVELLDPPRAAPAPARGALAIVSRGRLTWAHGLAWAATLLLAVSAGYFAAGRLGRSEPSPATDAAAPAAPPPEVAAAEADAVGMEAADSQAGPPPEPTRVRDERRAAPPAVLAESVAKPVAAPPPPESAASDTAVALERPAREQAAGGVPAPRAAREEAAKAAPRLLNRLAAAPRAAPALDADQPARFAAGRIADSAGFRLRLLPGIPLEEIVVADSVVRMRYATPWGALVVEQWRVGETVRARILAPPGAPRDSVAAWTDRVAREP